MVLKSDGTAIASNAFTPFDTSYTSYSDITKGKTVTMDLINPIGISAATLEASNAYAKAVTTNDSVWSGDIQSATGISVFTVPTTLDELNSTLPPADKVDYGSDNAVTVDYVFELTAKSDDTTVMTNTITIRVTYTKPSTNTASFSLLRKTNTTTQVPTVEKSLTTTAGVGDILN